MGDQSDCNWWNGEEGGGWMLVKTDVPCQREGSWQLMENNGRGVGRCFLGAVCHVGGLPLFIAPSSHLVFHLVEDCPVGPW